MYLTLNKVVLLSMSREIVTGVVFFLFSYFYSITYKATLK